MSVLDLPPEILNQCLQRLKFSDLCQVRATCKCLQKAVRNIHHGEFVSAERFQDTTQGLRKQL